MDRNFFRRVETAWPLEDREIKKCVLSELELMIKDNQNAWILQPDGEYIRKTCGKKEKKITAQTALLKKYTKMKV